MKTARACKGCGKGFEVYASSARLFCSKTCYTGSQRKYEYNRNCQVCGKAFRSGYRLYCSNECTREGKARAGRARATDPAMRFWKMVNKNGRWILDTQCWEWTGSLNNYGYGRFGHEGKLFRSHRWAYEQEYGTISDGMVVCHRCDNPPCVRPDHLFLGTAKDNAQDAVKKGRTIRGRKEPHLSREEREKIRRLYVSGHTIGAIVKMMGVTPMTVRRWK